MLCHDICWARRWSPGIHSPGVIKTPMHAPETHAFLAGLHPLRRMGEIREVVEAVLYLESAPFVSGETLHVDGGAHTGHW